MIRLSPPKCNSFLAFHQKDPGLFSPGPVQVFPHKAVRHTSAPPQRIPRCPLRTHKRSISSAYIRISVFGCKHLVIVYKKGSFHALDGMYFLACIRHVHLMYMSASAPRPNSPLSQHDSLHTIRSMHQPRKRMYRDLRSRL